MFHNFPLMLSNLIDWLFGDEEQHSNIKTSYEGLTSWLKDSDRKNLQNGKAVFTNSRSGFRGREVVNVRMKSPTNEQGNGRQTIIVEATKWSDKRGFHWVYSENKEQLNHGVKIFKKNNFDIHEEVGEKCYNGHHGKNNGDVFTH